MAKISVLDNSISSYQLEMYFMKYTINVFYCIFLKSVYFINSLTLCPNFEIQIL